eukprot:TRINITY_DN16022_c0_g1_i1.p1 TRINITY_DN16022_c0_g1~~TRINITY_DN16022_c0_g1_i1.p1  ORF type:complete len:245 (-),score=41.16 TRINITY_DN16022_c0_g1_i1:118-789(-)
MGRSHTGKAHYNILANTLGGPVLVMGVGTGAGLIDLCSSGCEVTALDYSQQMLDQFQKRLDQNPQCKCKLVQGDQAEPPLKEKFKLIVFSGTQLFHVPSERVRLCLKNCAELLAPGGIIYSESHVFMCSKGFSSDEEVFVVEDHPVLESITTKNVTVNEETTETMTVTTKTGEIHQFSWTLYILPKANLQGFIEEAGLCALSRDSFPLPPLPPNRMEYFLAKK